MVHPPLYRRFSCRPIRTAKRQATPPQNHAQVFWSRLRFAAGGKTALAESTPVSTTLSPLSTPPPPPTPAPPTPLLFFFVPLFSFFFFFLSFWSFFFFFFFVFFFLVRASRTAECRPSGRGSKSFPPPLFFCWHLQQKLDLLRCSVLLSIQGRSLIRELLSDTKKYILDSCLRRCRLSSIVSFMRLSRCVYV